MRWNKVQYYSCAGIGKYSIEIKKNYRLSIRGTIVDSQNVHIREYNYLGCSKPLFALIFSKSRVPGARYIFKVNTTFGGSERGFIQHMTIIICGRSVQFFAQ